MIEYVFDRPDERYIPTVYRKHDDGKLEIVIGEGTETELHIPVIPRSDHHKQLEAAVRRGW